MSALEESKTNDVRQEVEPAHLEHVTTDIEDLKTAQVGDRVDDQVQKYAAMGRVEIDEPTNRRLRRLIDRRVLVIMVLTYLVQALDKGTLSFTSIMGFLDDTHVDTNQYAWLSTCVYISILVVEYPTNWIIQRVPIAKYLGCNIIIWGSILALHSTVKNFGGILTVRILLGVFEACAQPSFVRLSSMWYKRSEQAETITFWYMMNGFQQMIGGLLAYLFSLIGADKVIKSWQALFITYGCASVLFGVFVLLFMPDSPMTATCFSEEDKRLMVERVRDNRTGIQNKKFRKYQVYEALSDLQMWCYCGIQLFTTMPTSGLGTFANIIIKGFDFTTLQTQLLSMVLGAYIILVLLTSTWLVKKTQQNLIVMAAYCIPSFIGTIVLMTVQNTTVATKAGLLMSYYITLSFWAAQTLTLSLISRNVAGQTKKSTVIAANFIAWAIGNAIGPQIFRSKDAPRYFTAFSVHLGCYTILEFILLFLRFHLKKQNTMKDQLQGVEDVESPDNGDLDGFEDLTDKENLRFRYVY
ncbi:2-ketogluconate transporter [Penicillium longicatenatum]|uniref:2-ketogluconate transporter n=1 Tax=Penicillium longicatenatum TaxID=1561947 RepID=UPI00254690A1|nr:2-ketogluconate transporter [Penicillium longicatenatum]KAJ5657891.1 2-ketogluconate transporter [Penicillium longicatenatum]